MDEQELKAEREKIATFLEAKAEDAQHRVLAARRSDNPEMHKGLEQAAERIKYIVAVFAEMVRTGFYEHKSEAPTEPAPTLKVKVIVEPRVADRLREILLAGEFRSLVTDALPDASVIADWPGDVWVSSQDMSLRRTAPNARLFTQPLAVMLQAALTSADGPTLYYAPGCSDADYELIKANAKPGSRIIRNLEDLYADA